MNETRQQKRHPQKEEYHFATPLSELLEQVIRDSEKELAMTRVNEWARAKEAADPTHMGKEQAERELGLYQQHARFLEERIAIIKLFMNERCSPN